MKRTLTFNVPVVVEIDDDEKEVEQQEVEDIINGTICDSVSEGMFGERDGNHIMLVNGAEYYYRSKDYYRNKLREKNASNS